MTGSTWLRAGRRGSNADRLTVQGQAELGINLRWRLRSAGCGGLMLQFNFDGIDIPLTHARKVCAQRITWNKPIGMSRWHSSADGCKAPRKEATLVRHFTHNVCLICFLLASAKIWVNSYQVSLIHIFMSYPGRHLHGCVCFCDAARFWDEQDGGVEERKRRAPDGLITCSAPCSDWSIPAEASRLNSRAARGGSRVDTRFNLTPALLTPFNPFGVCSSDLVDF